MIIIRLSCIPVLALILSLFFFASPPDTCAVETIYTIQTGSYDSEATAQKAFDALTELLTGKELDNLRIEKIGKFHSVRLGKFGTRDAADAFFATVKERLPGAVVMDAYYKPERIVSLYVSSPSTDVSRVEPKKASDRTEPPAIEKTPAVTAKKTEPPVPEETLTPEIPVREEPRDTVQSPVVTAKKTETPAVNKELTQSLEEQVQEIYGLVQKNDYESALKVIVSGINERPDSHELYGWYGAVLLKTDRPDRAATYYKRAVELSPQVSDYHNGVGYSLLFIKKLDEAIVSFNRALEIEPDYVDALVGLATSYAQSGDTGKASEVYNRVLPLDGEAAGKLGGIIKSGK